MSDGFAQQLLAANTAAPHPPNTNKNVPTNSAARRCAIVGADMWASDRRRVICVRKDGSPMSPPHEFTPNGAGKVTLGPGTQPSPMACSSTGLLRVTISGSALVNGKSGRSSMWTLKVAASTSRE